MKDAYDCFLFNSPCMYSVALLERTQRGKGCLLVTKVKLTFCDLNIMIKHPENELLTI